MGLPVQNNRQFATISITKQAGCQNIDEITTIIEHGNPCFLGLIIRRNSRASFAVLASMCIVTALTSSAVQEHVLRTVAVEHPAVITLLTVMSYFIIGALHMKATGDNRKAPLTYYGLLSLCSFLGIFLTNMAVLYMDYATRVVFKSAKILPVMTISSLLLGKFYSIHQWVSAFVLVLGIIFFSLGDTDDRLHFQTRGLPIICVAVCLDALTGNLEEKLFFKRSDPCSVQDVICHTSLLSSIFGAVSLCLDSQHSLAGIVLFGSRPDLVAKVFLFSTMNYVSLSLILLIIAVFGATEAELVKCFRRVLTIILSFAIFHKRVSGLHACGFAAVTISTVFGLRSSRDRVGI